MPRSVCDRLGDRRDRLDDAGAGSAGCGRGRSTLRVRTIVKCHSVDKKKDGPAFKEVAAKYKGKPDGQDRHRPSPDERREGAKFPDGHEEEHKIIKAKDPAEVKNLADWILSR